MIWLPVVTAVKVMRVMTADVGQVFPGDMRTLEKLTPTQAAALESMALERLAGKTPLIALLPTVWKEEHLWRRMTPELEESEDYRRAYRAAPDGQRGKVAALCVVRDIHVAGRTKRGLEVSEALIEVVGRVIVQALEIDSIVLARATSSHDMWVDELGASPVHVVHSLRPYADECARLHDTIRRMKQTNDVDRPLFDMITLDKGESVPYPRVPLNAYGDRVDIDPEITQLRAVSFAAWRVLRTYESTSSKDLNWAFATRSTLERLRRAQGAFRAEFERLLNYDVY